MNIALVGYGKMGKAIEQAALAKGHQIVLKINSSNKEELTTQNLKKADVAIEFSSPQSAAENIMTCLNAGLPVVCGTTGWNDKIPEAQSLALKNNTAFLHASNFSIGVNLFFEINRALAELMNKQTDYRVLLEEIHHIQKKDAPSGTAISLAETILENISRLKTWEKQESADESVLPVISCREDSVPGTHKVLYSSSVDDIEIIHTAHNREGFAKGAVLAAEFLKDKTGIFSMRDVLNV